MHVHKYWGCLQICWQRAENTHKFSADLLIRNALYWWQTLAFVKWFDVLKDKTGPNLFCCTLRLWKRASVCCGGLCSCVMDSAWQSALRQQLRTEKASQGNLKTFQGKKDKFQYKHSLIIQGRGLVAWYATAACLSMLISCNGPSTSSVSKNLCSQHR